VAQTKDEGKYAILPVAGPPDYAGTPVTQARESDGNAPRRIRNYSSVAVERRQFSVEARRGDTRFGICSTTFLEEAFRTDDYRIAIAFNDDGGWTYVTRTDLALHGKTPPFNHHDTNTLRRIAPPAPNPLVGLLKDTSPTSVGTHGKVMQRGMAPPTPSKSFEKANRDFFPS
jgi:hypothetical protein